jgi:ribokinase
MVRDHKFDFIGFGALNVDIFYSLLPNKKSEDITPDLHPGGEIIGTEQKRNLVLKNAIKYATITGKSGGGQAANTTAALARMGFRCGFIGKVGNDDLGDILLDSLENIDKSHVQRDGNSGVCLCILDQDGERANVVFPGCNDKISISESDIGYMKNGKILHLTSFCSKDVLELQKQILENDINDTIITFDPGEIYSRHGVKNLYGILKRTKILFATTEELKLMTNREPQEAIKEIIDYGTKIVVCKMSERGSIIISDNVNITVPVSRVEKVIDKTGAGDVYAAGFIAGILSGLSLETCGKLASNTAALSISGYGRKKYPDKNFLKHFLPYVEAR